MKYDDLRYKSFSALQNKQSELSLDEYQKLIKTKRCSCGFKSLDKLDIEHYPHTGGWNVKGFNEKQWLYVTCPHCRYQWALWKLGVTRQ